MSTPAMPMRRETGPSAVALGVAAVLTWLVLDALVSPGLGAVLAVGFVATCVWLALTIRGGDFFVVGVLPPLLLAGVLLLAALLGGAGLEGTTALARTVGGLADLRWALVTGWLGTLGVLLVRSRASRASTPGPQV